MNYRHSYHAGNFADVIKHSILVTLLLSLTKKDKPLCFLDTHAGSGLYDLTSIASQKTEEYKQGIFKLFPCNGILNSSEGAKDIPNPVKTYLAIVEKFNDDSTSVKDNPTKEIITYYPGSTLIAHDLLKPKDSIIACEWVTEEAKNLKKHLKNRSLLGTKSAVHQQDGYLALKSFLPCKEKRGLILIDPPFEKQSEWLDIVRHLKQAYQRFPQGVYAIWYPIKDQRETKSFLQNIKKVFHHSDAMRSAQNKAGVLNVECVFDRQCFSLASGDSSQTYTLGLAGTGMLIVNPPWQIENEVTTVVNWLWSAMDYLKNGGCSVHWLIPSG